MNLELSDDQAAALEREVTAIINGVPLATHSDVARDSQHDPTGAETRTAPRAEALLAAASR
jgi:hypothetical protein